jgi:hypothetical protein
MLDAAADAAVLVRARKRERPLAAGVARGPEADPETAAQKKSMSNEETSR